MTQLRRHADEFLVLNVAVLIVGPEGESSFAAYWRKAGLDAAGLPFVGIPDPEERILELYAQPKRLLRLGRMPMQVLIDTNGEVRWQYTGSSMRDIPDMDQVLEECRKLKNEN
jgi:peroxiredoxin